MSLRMEYLLSRGCGPPGMNGLSGDGAVFRGNLVVELAKALKYCLKFRLIVEGKHNHFDVILAGFGIVTGRVKKVVDTNNVLVEC